MEQFHCPQNPLCSAYLSLPVPEPLATTDLFIVSIVEPFPEGHRAGTIQHAAFSDWLRSLTNMHARSSMSFDGLIAHFFLVRIFHCLNVPQFIHLPQDILAASKLWQL